MKFTMEQIKKRKDLVKKSPQFLRAVETMLPIVDKALKIDGDKTIEFWEGFGTAAALIATMSSCTSGPKQSDCSSSCSGCICVAVMILADNKILKWWRRMENSL